MMTVLTSQLQPRLTKGLAALAEQGVELTDWVSVYRPMSKYLLASARHTLQVSE